MPRELPEWIGKTPDSVPPPRVKLRILERYGHRCYLSGREIREGDSWQVEHIKALVLDGENRESNMAPALTDPHKAKSKIDVGLKSKAATIRKKRFGLTKASRPMPGGRASPFKIKIGGEVVRR